MYPRPVIVIVLGLIVSGCATAPALHAIGVYEGQLAEGADAGREVVVNVTDDTRPLVLALMAYEKTLWKISLKEGVRLNKVILAGYHAQSVTGLPTDVPVEAHTYDPSPCDRCLQDPKYFYSYDAPPAQLKELTHLDVTSFQGRYQGTEFWIFPGLGTAGGQQ